MKNLITCLAVCVIVGSVLLAMATKPEEGKPELTFSIPKVVDAPLRNAGYFEYGIWQREFLRMMANGCCPSCPIFTCDALEAELIEDEYVAIDTPFSINKDLVCQLADGYMSSVVETAVYGAPNYMTSVVVNKSVQGYMIAGCGHPDDCCMTCWSRVYYAGDWLEDLQDDAWIKANATIKLKQPLPDGVYFAPLQLSYGLHSSYSCETSQPYDEPMVADDSNNPGLTLVVNAGGSQFSRSLAIAPEPDEISDTVLLWVPFPSEETWIEFELRSSFNLFCPSFPFMGNSSCDGQAIVSLSFSFPEPDPIVTGGIDWNDYFVIVHPDTAYKLGDVTRDGNVNIEDILAIVSEWGPCEVNPPEEYCDTDTDHNLVVDVVDLLRVLNDYGWDSPPLP